jgi:hypothetical protein
MSRLKIFNGSTDLTLLLENYLDAEQAVDFAAGTTLDVGYYKPINALYIEVKTAAAAASELSVTHSTAISSVIDKTKGLTQSGFVTWSRDDNAKITLHGEELYWYKISISDEEVELNGVNLVFAEDVDLQEEYPAVMSYLPEGKTSFIGYHQAVRNHILTYLRNKGKNATNSNGVTKLLDQFDLHDHEEVRQAAKFLALSKIFANESDQAEDKWDIRAKSFYAKYTEAINLNFLSVDNNDDGVKDTSEQQAVQFIRIERQ